MQTWRRLLGFACLPAVVALLPLRLPGPAFTISTIAGGDNGPATSIPLDAPSSVAVDASGNLYIAEPDDHCVRRVSAAGVITTFAGIQAQGFSGDGGPANLAQLNGPSAVAVDGSGNVFISDTGNNRIRKVTTDGTISTVAGTGIAGFSGDGGFATAAQINGFQLNSLAVDGSGNLFFPDPPSGRVRRVTPSGVISTIAGGGNTYVYPTQPLPPNGTQAVGVTLIGVISVATDAAGNVYIGAIGWPVILVVTPAGIMNQVPGAAFVWADALAISATRGVCYANKVNSTVGCIDSAGTIHAVAGVTQGYSGDGGLATSANLWSPQGLAFDIQGNLYIADSGNNRIRRVTPGGVIGTVAGNDGKRAILRLNGVAADGAGNAYFGDDIGAVVRRVSPSGTLTTVAGGGNDYTKSGNVQATSVGLNGAANVTLDPSGNFYFSETAYGPIDKVTLSGVITTLASLSFPVAGLAVDSTGAVYAAQYLGSRVGQVMPGGSFQTVAGTGVAWSAGDGEPAPAAELNQPQQMAVDSAGNIYVPEQVGNRVRKFKPGGTISTVAGNGTCAYEGDGGPATAASLCGPNAVAIGPDGSVYIADSGNSAIRRVDANGVITTFAGTGIAGYGGDGGAATTATLNFPTGVAVDAGGNVYIGDAQNYAVRKVAGGTLCGLVTTSGARAVDSTAASGSFNVTVPAGCGFTATSDSPWLHVSAGSQGSGTTAVQYNVDANSTQIIRSGALHISAPGSAATFAVYQSGSGCQFALDTSDSTNVNSLNLGFSTGQSTLFFSTSCAAWLASSNRDWLILTAFVPGDQLNSQVGYSYPNNPTAQSRTATVTINGQALTVTQDPSPVVMLSPSPGSRLTSTSATFTWSSTSGANYQYQIGSTLGGTDIASGTTAGNSVTVNSIPCDNRAIYVRLWYAQYGYTAYLPLPIDSIYASCASANTTCPVNFNSPAPVDSSPQTISIAVTADPSCTWSFFSDANWLEAGSASPMTGNGTIVVRVAANDAVGARTGTIVVGAGVLTVTQRQTAATFSDVPATSDFFDAINLMRGRSITSGCQASPPAYCSNDNITRGQMAVFIVRAVMGNDNFSYTVAPYFSDVPASHPFFRWVQKMRDLGITSGCGATEYCPDDTVNRGQMAVFVIRARYGATVAFSYSPAPLFSDVPASDPYFQWIQKMKQAGITSGCAAQQYCPNDPVTRGQMAVFLMRGAFNQLMPEGTPSVLAVSPPAVTRGQQYYTIQVIGLHTNFTQQSQATLGDGISVVNVFDQSSTSLLVGFAVPGTATVGPRSIVITTGTEEAVLPNGLWVQ